MTLAESVRGPEAPPSPPLAVNSPQRPRLEIRRVKGRGDPPRRVGATYPCNTPRRCGAHQVAAPRKGSRATARARCQDVGANGPKQQVVSVAQRVKVPLARRRAR